MNAHELAGLIVRKYEDNGRQIRLSWIATVLMQEHKVDKATGLLAVQIAAAALQVSVMS